MNGMKKGFIVTLMLAVLGLSALFVLGFVAVGIFWAYSTRNDFLWLTLENIPYKT